MRVSLEDGASDENLSPEFRQRIGWQFLNIGNIQKSFLGETLLEPPHSGKSPRTSRLSLPFTPLF